MRAVPVIVVHGGAGRIADGAEAAAEAGFRAAAERGRACLQEPPDDLGTAAVDAVVAAVRSLEDDPTFNAGRGACMSSEGTFEMDAGIMRSIDRRSGAVAAVPDLADAITVARALMEEGPHCLLAAQGAVRFARARGIGTFGRDAVWTEKAQARFDQARRERSGAQGQADTVGAVAIDARGRLCAGCSTGGVLLKAPGRVGDSPVCGAGFYAARELGAACATGLGEAILTHVAAYEVLRRVAAGEQPEAAAAEVCDRVAEGGTATCGLIVVTPDGRVGVAHNSRHMSWSIARGGEPVTSGVSRPR